MGNGDKQLLKEILEVLELRTKKHVIVYSSRLLPLIPKIKEALNKIEQSNKANPL